MSFELNEPTAAAAHTSRLSQVLRVARDGLLRLLVAPRCAGCDERLPEHTHWCRPCHQQLRPLARVLMPPDDAEGAPLSVYAAGPFEGALSRSVARFKYRGRTDLAEVLAAAALGALPEERRWDALVPVPLHPRRLAERGYNQAGLLARSLSRRSGIPVEHDWLRRIVLTAPQATLDRSARLDNVRAAFRATSRVTSHARVLLIDDVATTGATAMACAQALTQVGAEHVSLLAIALADKDGAAT